MNGNPASALLQAIMRSGQLSLNSAEKGEVMSESIHQFFNSLNEWRISCYTLL